MSIGKNPIPKEKLVAIILEYHFTHPAWYKSLWIYSKLDQGAHSVYLMKRYNYEQAIDVQAQGFKLI